MSLTVWIRSPGPDHSGAMGCNWALGQIPLRLGKQNKITKIPKPRAHPGPTLRTQPTSSCFSWTAAPYTGFQTRPCQPPQLHEAEEVSRAVLPARALQRPCSFSCSFLSPFLCFSVAQSILYYLSFWSRSSGIFLWIINPRWFRNERWSPCRQIPHAFTEKKEDWQAKLKSF